MKKSLRYFYFFAAFLFSLPIYSESVWDGTASVWTTGSGTESDPYQIQTAQNLAYLAQSVNAGNSYAGQYFIQTDDINLNKKEWTPIGGENKFEAQFDGANHKIKGIKVSTAKDYSGLFGYSTNVIKNLSVLGSISGGKYSGGISGYSSGDIENCNNSCEVYSSGLSQELGSYSYSGGITGFCSGTINNCRNSGKISSTMSSDLSSTYAYSGGISGAANSINRCDNSGDISSRSECGVYNSSSRGYSYAGGICGIMRYGTGSVYMCRNTGNVSAISSSAYYHGESVNICAENSYSGGIAGICYSSDIVIECCYSVGKVSATRTSSGIANKATIKNSYSVGTITGCEDYEYGVGYGTITNCYRNACCGAGSYKTADEMRSASFPGMLSNVFVQDVNNINNGFPIFKREQTFVVRFLNYDGAILQSETLAYGVTPCYKGAEPQRPSSKKYSYRFKGWNNTITPVDKNIDYKATYAYTVNKYLITFENYNGDELQSSEVEYGQMPSYAGATPEKPADAEFTYTFSGWSPEVVAVAGAQTYTAQFNSTVNKYVVRFLNEDGTELQSEELEYGTVPVYSGEVPTKQATAQYTYTFNGWDSEIGKVTGAKDYTATYFSTTNKYLITFENYNGAELQSSEVEYGQIPAYSGATPEKPADAEFTYSFSGWSPEVVSVVGAQTYTAQFSSTVNKYVIRFLNEDGIELQSEELDYGTVPVYTGETPTKEATAQYTYTFNGWDSEIGKVTGVKDYTATYSSTVNKYLIAFENYNGEELQSSEVEYGQIPSYTGATPEKPADAEFTYTFSGWSPEVVTVVGAQIYTAQFSSTTNKYLVRFLNEDGTELQNEELDYGAIPVYSGETPTKDATAQYTYTFSGWDSEIGKVTGAKDYTATYSSTVNKYLITFENYNGDELQSSEVEYGQTPSYTGTTPEKHADAEFTYTFSGWSPDVVAVVGAQTYTAQYSSTVNKYIVRFLNEDGSELQSEELDYGTVPVYSGEVPTKQATAQYTYTFSGWDSEIGKVTGAKDYTATYSSTTNKYLITFENYNGDELQSSEVEYGQMPSYTGATPEKPADAEFTYAFSGWSPEVVSVVGAQTYTAQFSGTVNKYVIRFLNEDGTELQSEDLDYGAIPVYKGETPTKDATARYTYTFNGWDSEVGKVTGAKDYTATYTSTINKYLITFENYNGEELQSSEVEYGQTPSYTGATPEKSADAEFTYSFSGWSPEVVAVIGAQTYTAQFSSTTKKYTVTLSGINCDVMGEGAYDYGTIVELKATPNECTHFIGWSDGEEKGIRTITVTGDVTLTATAEMNTYNVDAYSSDKEQGSVISSAENPIECGASVIIEAVPNESYAFQRWSDGNTDNPRTIVVDRDYDISAQWNKITPVPTYDVRLIVYKDDTWGTVTGDGTYKEGETATLNAVPASGYKFSYWYDPNTQERFYENPLSFVVEKDVSLTASFSRPPKIKVTYGQRSAEAEGDADDDVISYVVSTKQHVDIDNVGSRSILIYNTAGQIMLRQVNIEHYEGHLPSGIYIINIDGVMEKFIVR